jgi:hypothetical protein
MNESQKHKKNKTKPAFFFSEFRTSRHAPRPTHTHNAAPKKDKAGGFAKNASREIHKRHSLPYTK